MKKMKKQSKTILSWLLVLTIVAGYFTGISFESKASLGTVDGYETYTFSDLGIADKTYSGFSSGNWKGYDWNYGFDKVALTGYITLSNGTSDMGIAFDNKAENYPYGGLRLRTYGNQIYFGKDNGYTGISASKFFASSVVNEKIKFRMTFDTNDQGTADDTSDDILTVNLILNDILVATKTYADSFYGSFDAFYIMASAADPVTLESIGKSAEETETAITHDEFTFSDLGIADNQYSGFSTGNWKSYSWNYGFDKVALTGYITLSNGTSDMGIAFDNKAENYPYGGLRLRTYGNQIYFGKDGGYTGISASKFNATSVVGEKIKFKITFDISDQGTTDDTSDDILTVNLILNDIHVATKTYAYSFYGSFDAFYIMASAADPVTLESTTPDTSEFDGYTFRSVGIKDGSYTSNKSADWAQGFDKVFFTGKLTFPAKVDDINSGIAFSQPTGDPSAGIHFRIYADALTIIGPGVTKSMQATKCGLTTFANQTITLHITFEEMLNYVRMTVTVNDLATSKTVAVYSKANVTPLKRFSVLGNATAPIGVESITLGTQNVTKAATSYNLRAHDHETEQKYLVAGDATVTKNGEAYAVTNSEISEPGDYTIVTNALEGLTHYIYTQDVALYILGDIDLDGTAGTEADLAALEALVKAQAYKPTKAAEYAADIDNDGKVGAKDLELLKSTGFAEKADYPEILNDYKVYSFVNRGLADNTYTSTQKKAWYGSWLTSYDKIAFAGEITFPAATTDTGIRFLVSDSTISGIFLHTYGGNVILEAGNVGGPATTSISASKIGVTSVVDTPIKFYMLFDESDNDTVSMTLIMNEYQGTFTLNAAKMKALTRFHLHATSAQPAKVKTIDINKEVDTTGYEVYTFSDMDVADGEKKASAYKSWTYGYGKVAFRGEIEYSSAQTAGDNGETGIRFISTSSRGTKGLYIRRYGTQIVIGNSLDGSLAETPISNALVGVSSVYDVPIKVYVLFDKKDDDSVTVKLIINDYEETGTYTASQIEQVKYLRVDASSTDPLTVRSIEDQPTLTDVLKKYHVPAQTYDYIGGNDVMPISGYFGPYGTHINDDVFQKIKDSGINLVVYAPLNVGEDLTMNTVRKQLSLASKYGLGWFVEDCRLNPQVNIFDKTGDATAEMLSATELATKLGDYAYYDSFLGNILIDEPSYRGSSATTEYRFLDYYLDASRQLNSYANLTGYINSVSQEAFPVNKYEKDDTNVVGAAWGAKKDDLYDEYWAQFTDKEYGAGAKVYSADDYPRKNGWLGGGGYFRTLGTLRNQSLANSTPFWYYAQAGGEWTDANTINTSFIPSEAETYWNVNTALAFGAKGISWFPIVQNSKMDGTMSDPVDRCGIILSDGTESRYYAWVQKANAQIAAVDEVLMKANSTAIVASGAAKTSATGTVPADGQVEEITTTTVLDNYGKLSAVSSTHDKGALVGCFDYRDTEAFYVVNFNADGTTKDTITVTLNGAYDYRCIQDGKETYGTATGNTVTLSLAPGTAALIVLEDRVVAYDSADVTVGVAPDAEPGYIFLGWFNDEACGADAQITDLASYEGTLYAKFVADEVLSVKAQLSADAKTLDAENKPISMRFVSSVYVSPEETLQYKTVGFMIKNTVTLAEKTTVQKTVYKELLTTYGANTKSWTPEDVFGQMSARFYAYSIWDIPQDAHDYGYEVTPYWITLDGTTVYGETTIKTVNQGLKALGN